MIYALRDWGRALEDKYAYEQTLNFRAEARRTKLIGLWAASLLGLADKQRYAHDLVLLVVGRTSVVELATRLRQDFDAAGVAVSDAELEGMMSRLTREARHELEAA
jgi:hypothetical protein